MTDFSNPDGYRPSMFIDKQTLLIVNIIEIAILPKTACKFNVIPVKIPKMVFAEPEKKNNIKIHMNPDSQSNPEPKRTMLEVSQPLMSHYTTDSW